jgi:hypothetical protein
MKARYRSLVLSYRGDRKNNVRLCKRDETLRVIVPLVSFLPPITHPFSSPAGCYRYSIFTLHRERGMRNYTCKYFTGLNKNPPPSRPSRSFLFLFRRRRRVYEGAASRVRNSDSRSWNWKSSLPSPPLPSPQKKEKGKEKIELSHKFVALGTAICGCKVRE